MATLELWQDSFFQMVFMNLPWRARHYAEFFGCNKDAKIGHLTVESCLMGRWGDLMPWSWYLFSLFSHCLSQKKFSITPESWQARVGEERRRVIWAGLCIIGPTENFCNQLERLRFISLLTSAQLPTHTYSTGCYWPPSGSGDSIPVCLFPFKFQV